MDMQAGRSIHKDNTIATFRGIYISPEMLMDKLDALIDVHFKEERSPDLYSVSMAFITKTLNAITKAQRGKTVFVLIQDRILKEAKHLLLTTNMPVKTMSFILGFEDPAYFSRFFKRMSGMAPKAYRINSRSIISN